MNTLGQVIRVLPPSGLLTNGQHTAAYMRQIGRELKKIWALETTNFKLNIHAVIRS